MAGWTFTDPFHRQPYPSISPTRPELSQAGRTVLVTGGAQGVGLAISKAFLQASASKVVIVSRRQATMNDGLKELESYGLADRVVSKICDMSDAEAAARLWADLRDEGTIVDVLVLNAVAPGVHPTILEAGTEEVWRDYSMNARAQLDFTERFYKQSGQGSSSKVSHNARTDWPWLAMSLERKSDTPQYLVNISTFAIHDWEANKRPAYGLTKNAGALIMQLIARDTPPETLQIVSVNPGPNFTRSAQEAGYKEDEFQWNSSMIHMPSIRATFDNELISGPHR